MILTSAPGQLVFRTQPSGLKREGPTIGVLARSAKWAGF